MSTARVPDYAPYYCEENIWQLAQSRAFSPGQADVVFISNAQRSCPLWSQRACLEHGEPVFWDYHVVLVIRGPVNTVMDLDSTLGSPLEPARWWDATFPYIDYIVPEFRPRFRLVDASVFARIFSSDRSHMRRDDGTWNATPPAWPCIRPASGGVDLQRFIEMNHDSRSPGRVLSDADFMDYLLGAPAYEESV